MLNCGMANFTEITCSSALNRLDETRHPYPWDMNIYRGCQHGCRYCYAVYSHRHTGSDDFYGDIYIKANIAEQLERKLSSPSWKREVINIGGVTDSYQPAEAKYRLMPDILRLLIKYRTPCIISTKSDLVLRDYDLIDQLSRMTYVNVAASVTSMDEDVRTKLEPGSVPGERRFEMLKQFSKTEASTGLHLMPIIPYITDSVENINIMYSLAKDAGVSYALPGVMYLRGPTRQVFFDAVREHFPDKLPALLQLYQTGGAGNDYKTELYTMLNGIRAQHGVSGNYSRPMREKLQGYTQLSFL